jgi:2-polyprenyl-3-methyl-5-hydroxy-6-metoxy-1,4-benzoquinol methylase
LTPESAQAGTDVASMWGADVVGVDLSYAVEQLSAISAASERMDRAGRYRRFRSSASFDVVFSIGVLHHPRHSCLLQQAGAAIEARG